MIYFEKGSDGIDEEQLRKFERLADICLAEEGMSPAAASLSLTVVTEDEIRRLNSEYLGRDSVTDVLSFPQYGRSELEALLAGSPLTDADMQGEELPEGYIEICIGDVVICLEQAERQAEEYGHGLARELSYLFVHSVMHLLGYDHKDEEEKRFMRAKEEKILAAEADSGCPDRQG